MAKRQAAIGGFAVDVAIDLESERRLAPDTETAIYRIVQEALSNAVKHAGAEHVASGSGSCPTGCSSPLTTTAGASTPAASATASG